MELQNFVNTHCDYLERFKESGCRVNRFQNYVVVKQPYGSQVWGGDDYWKMYCRGAVINTESHKVVCVPPVKAQTGKMIPTDSESEYQPLIDGTMVNVWYALEKGWTISTRGEIGGHNKWMKTNCTFREMFEECLDSEVIETLDKSCSYSFVIRHKSNRNVSPVFTNEAYLVEMYRFKDGLIERLDHSEYPSDSRILKVESTRDSRSFLDINGNPNLPPMPYHFKGYTVKAGNQRYKCLNPLFERVQEIKGDSNNLNLNFLILRKNGNLKEYLRYFPEHQHKFNEYRDTLHKMSNDLYNTYKDVYIYKKRGKSEIPYHLNPMIREIHQKYISSIVADPENKGTPTKWSDIKDYIYNLPPKRLMFAINYVK